MDEISSRHIPTYFEAESFLSKDAVFGLLADPSRGNITDKARLAVAYVLNAPAGLVDAEEIKRLLSTTAAVIVAPTAEAASGALPQPADPEKLAEALAAVDYAVTTRRTTAAMSGESTSGPTSAGGSFMGMVSPACILGRGN